MGYQAAFHRRWNGETIRVIAALERHSLILRGMVRVTIRLARVTDVAADAGCLRLRSGPNVAELVLGAQAARWNGRRE